MTDWDPHKRLLTVTEVAESIDRPTGTIYRWISEGRLTAYARHGKHWLYLEADVLKVEAATRQQRTS